MDLALRVRGLGFMAQDLIRSSLWGLDVARAYTRLYSTYTLTPYPSKDTYLYTEQILTVKQVCTA